jgi:outer membrane immunogenic protein
MPVSLANGELGAESGGAAFSFAASGFAFAADMAVKAPPAPLPAPVYNWTGWYAGVNAGASFGNVKTDFNAFPLLTGFGLTPVAVGGFSNTEYPSGFIGGGQIGYNWQYSPLIVVGLEADFQGALERDSNNLSNPFSVSVPAGGGHVLINSTTVTDHTTQIDWFGTVRARIGYVWGNGEVMSYLTGGLAYGEVKINGTSAVGLGTEGPNPFGPVSQTFGHSQVNVGWVVGYGTEGHLPLMPGNWTWKIEGLYMDLGTLDVTGSGGSVLNFANSGVPFTTTAGPVTTHSHFTDGILRGGLNYKFY